MHVDSYIWHWISYPSNAINQHFTSNGWLFTRKQQSNTYPLPLVEPFLRRFFYLISTTTRLCVRWVMSRNRKKNTRIFFQNRDRHNSWNQFAVSSYRVIKWPIFLFTGFIMLMLFRSKSKFRHRSGSKDFGLHSSFNLSPTSPNQENINVYLGKLRSLFDFLPPSPNLLWNWSKILACVFWWCFCFDTVSLFITLLTGLTSPFGIWILSVYGLLCTTTLLIFYYKTIKYDLDEKISRVKSKWGGQAGGEISLDYI